MIDYTKCQLYGISSKKHLLYLLHMDKTFLKQNYCLKEYSPFLKNQNGKKRLIENPSDNLKRIQSTIKNYLSELDIPENVFSGVKKRSYISNAKYHQEANYLLAIDISGFFPSISREKVFNFFNKKLACSLDISTVLTNLTTINIYPYYKNYDEISMFLKSKKIKTFNHLVSGAPTSQLLSYLANIDLFDELQNLSDKYQIKMSIYVDDVTFSSKHPIPKFFKENVERIVNSYGYNLSKSKVKRFRPEQVKLVTGVAITPEHKIKIKNSLSRRTIVSFKKYKKEPTYEEELRLKGLVTACRQIDKSAFPSVKKYVFKES